MSPGQGHPHPPLAHACPAPHHPTPPAHPTPRSALPCYVHLLELFHEVTFKTAHGQLLDTTTAPIGTVSARGFAAAGRGPAPQAQDWSGRLAGWLHPHAGGG